MKFAGARDLAQFLAASDEVHQAFVKQLFQYLVKQPVRAYGPATLADLTHGFAQKGYNMRELVDEIAATGGEVQGVLPMTRFTTRREVLRRLGIGAAVLPLVWNLPSLCFGGPLPQGRKRRLVLMFSPNGVVPPTFWPDAEGELKAFNRACSRWSRFASGR